MQRMYRSAQTQLSKLVPGARHVIAQHSGHYIQIHQPKLVIDAIRQVVTEARRREHSASRR
jgi:pimeloyl-ACP methyl ester carboxylesterase